MFKITNHILDLQSCFERSFIWYKLASRCF
jgi:hypothetical protein